LLAEFSSAVNAVRKRLGLIAIGAIAVGSSYLVAKGLSGQWQEWASVIQLAHMTVMGAFLWFIFTRDARKFHGQALAGKRPRMTSK
jgi:hypothetical protein